MTLEFRGKMKKADITHNSVMLLGKIFFNFSPYFFYFSDID